MDVGALTIFILFLGPRTLIRIATSEDRLKIDEVSEPVPPNPLGDEKPEGTGLESVANLISVDSLLAGIPNLTENFANFGKSKFGNFFRRSSIPVPDESSDRCTSPAEEAIAGSK